MLKVRKISAFTLQLACHVQTISYRNHHPHHPSQDSGLKTHLFLYTDQTVLQTPLQLASRTSGQIEIYQHQRSDAEALWCTHRGCFHLEATGLRLAGLSKGICLRQLAEHQCCTADLCSMASHPVALLNISWKQYGDI